MKPFPNKSYKIFAYLTVGVLFYTIMLLINPWDYSLNFNFFTEVFSDLSITLAGVVFIMELGFLITKKLDIYFPWRSSIGKRVLLQLAVQVLLVSVTLYLIRLAIPDLFTDVNSFRQSFVTGITLTILFSAVFTAGSFFVQWNKTVIEAAKYEKRAAKAELEFLKMQINPHFLFNNFSTLASLIEEDPAVAVEYVQRLSNIYRHVLKERDQNVVPLSDELEFIKSYLFLYETRYQNSLDVKIDIPEKYFFKGMAPATMQLLVENSIKHNSISRNAPLKIEIYIHENFLIVKNNINPKLKPAEGSGIGLKNISERYLLLGNREVIINKGKDSFLVKVPLLERNQ